jgi:hypothetical protein
VPCGRSGSYARLAGELARIAAAGYAAGARELLAGRGCARRVAVRLALLPALPLLPLVALGVHLHERRFGERLFAAFQSAYGWAPPARRAGSTALPQSEAA